MHFQYAGWLLTPALYVNPNVNICLKWSEFYHLVVAAQETLQRRQLKFKQPALLRDWTRFVSKALKIKISTKTLITVADTHGSMMKYSQGSTIPHGLTMLGFLCLGGLKMLIISCILCMYSPGEFYFGNIEYQYEITSSTMKTIHLGLFYLIYCGSGRILFVVEHFRTRK